MIKKARRYIQIDSENRCVKEQYLDGDHLENMQKLVGGFVERAPQTISRRTHLLVDEEGRIKDPPLQNGFTYDGGPFYVGNGVLCAMSERSDGTEIELAEASRKVRFFRCMRNQV